MKRVLLTMACLGVATAAQAQNAAPLPIWHDDPETCRRITDAILHGQVQNAQDLFMPDGASDALRANIHQLMLQLAESAAAATDHQPPRLERVLPDARIGRRPVAVELWTFGDREAYLVGCAIRPYGDQARISIQAYPTVDELLAHMRPELALPGDANDPAP